MTRDISREMTELIIGPLDAIPLGEGRTYSVRGEDIAVFRARSGQLFAVQAACPHRGGPLADGLLGGTMLICPLHAWKFDIATGQALFGECGIKTFPVRLDDAGQIVLGLDTHEDSQ
jgi:nitrite reductase [NAD(P)H] small subunit